MDAGEIRLHVRNPPGTRIEQTEVIFGNVERAIRKDIPPDEIDTMLDNMGIPNSSINLSLSDGSLMSPADGEILISLKPGHRPTDQYIDRLNADLPKTVPGANLLLSARGHRHAGFEFRNRRSDRRSDRRARRQPAEKSRNRPGNAGQNPLAARRGGRSAGAGSRRPGRARQCRSNAGKRGGRHAAAGRQRSARVSQRNRAAFAEFLDQSANRNPIQRPGSDAAVQDGYDVRSGQHPGGAVRCRIRQLHWLQRTQLLGNLADIKPGRSPSNITHYQVRPTFDILAGVRHTDLGSVADGVERIMADARKSLPRGSSITLRGQVQSMRDSFRDMAFGLIFAIVLVYLLMVINFQSWLDPLIILMALPGALAGILWMLFLTATTISVPSLMGAIMSIGVATSNSILMITFANDQRKEGKNSHDAALAAGITRLRPVIMTALAMIIGMLPMSLGLGEGGEQNAPLGRAVIGGLAMATFATLFFVPVVYSKLRQTPPQTHVEEELR